MNLLQTKNRQTLRHHHLPLDYVPRYVQLFQWPKFNNSNSSNIQYLSVLRTTYWCCACHFRTRTQWKLTLKPMTKADFTLNQVRTMIIHTFYMLYLYIQAIIMEVIMLCLWILTVTESGANSTMMLFLGTTKNFISFSYVNVLCFT